MTNVMLDPLPREWEDPETGEVYLVNCDYRIGIQISLAQYDSELTEYDKVAVIMDLMFYDDDTQSQRPMPQGESAERCIKWFMNGWHHDRHGNSEEKRRLIDYDIDQWRIYADFRSIYGIDLATEDMHWWKFCGLLWNMPYKQSSFLQVIEIRRKKKEDARTAAEKNAIQTAQQIYALDQPEVEYTTEQKEKIDEYDALMEKVKQRKRTEEEALAMFRK